MELVRDSWTDERLDDLNHRVDEGFRRVDEGFRRVDEKFERVDDRLDALQRTMVHGVIALSSSMVAGFVAFAALIATQL